MSEPRELGCDVMVAINYDIPEDLHRAFKALAAIRGLTVKALLLQLMEEAVDKERDK